MDYVNFSHFAEAIFSSSTPLKAVFGKEQVKTLLGMACSNRERELLQYSVFKTSGLSATRARKEFGFERMKERASKVEECVEAARSIREAIDKLSCVEEKAILAAMGLQEIESSDSDEDIVPSSEVASLDEMPLPSFSTMLKVVEQGGFNWFVVKTFMEQEGHEHNHEHLNLFYSYALNSPLSSMQKNILTTSYAAFEASQPDINESRIADLLSGDIVSDSESDNPEDYVGITSLASENVKKIVARKRKALKRKVQRLKNKRIAESNFLSRKQITSVVEKFPDIGETIESFVSDANVGADAWRRTGVLTFDGNSKVKQKVTYGRIQQHLQEKYKHKFSYGTVIQLCVARNKRRRSSANYKGVAKVTTRRARKGFELKYNPDNHWSGALYGGLSMIQYTDGCDINNINRDDASGFRLDTLTTHGKHATPTVSGQDVLTTHTDYVNKYPSILRTTSYNFTATKTSKEKCAGVVKAAKVYPKNSAQHYADLEMLSTCTDLQSAFTNPLTDKPKRIECVRVDGACDEGPSHVEVKFWWAARHLDHGKLVTLVSSRSSGCSYLNRVELKWLPSLGTYQSIHPLYISRVFLQSRKW